MRSAEDRYLLRLARAAVRHQLLRGRSLYVRPWRLPPAVKSPGASFVSLHRNGRLRGCIGSIEPRRPLAVDVAANACAAAFGDPRFPPLSRPELADTRFEISLLEPLQELQFEDAEQLLQLIVPRRDGLLIQRGDRRGVFLPLVWDSLPDPQQFLRQLRVKAGLPADDPLRGTRGWRFSARKIALAGCPA